MFKCTSFDLEQDWFKILDTEDFITEEYSFDEVSDYLNSGLVIDDLPDIFVKKVSNNNKNLSRAKKEKNDEFYTQLSDIENELSHYPVEAFKDKVIYLPMDIAITDGAIKQSKFVTYFQMHAHKLQFKKLIATCLVDKTDGEGRNYYVLNRQTVSYCTPENQANGKSPIEEVKRDDGRIYYKYRLTSNTPTHEYQLDEDGFRYVPVPDTTINQAILDEDGAHTYKGASGAWDNQLYRFVDNLDTEDFCPSDENWSSGDFRSEFCGKLFDQADIIVTNPPFSLFRDFVAELMKHQKKFLIIGNKNAITYKEFFPLLKNNEVWIGCNSPSEFSTPDGLTKKLNGLTRWFTNLDINKRHEKLILWKNYTSEEYPKYANYDAINVNKVSDIPCDYDGAMGVPITFMDKYNPEQFEIVGLGIANLGLECGVKPYKPHHKKYRKEVQRKGQVDGDLYMVDENDHPVVPYARILIRRK